MNNRNRKNPTVIAWEQLRMLLVRFTERMSAFDSMVERQGRDIGVDEVYNEIQNIRSQLDQIQNGLNLYQNKINNERMVDKSQPQIPLTINNQTQNTGNNNDMNENRSMAKKQVVRLNENQLRKIVKESVKRVLNDENDIIKTFKHCHISKHPLKDEYMVVNDTFKNIPPFFGTKLECEKAAIAADKSAENHLNTLIEKARKDGYSEDEISKAVEKLLKRTI